MDAPHSRAPEEVAAALGTDVESGLSEDEAGARLARVGPNRIALAARPSYAVIALRQLADPLVALLIAAAAVSAAIGEEIEAAAIGAIVLLNAALGFVQEAGAERAVHALRASFEPLAGVVREGHEREVGAAELVPGDLVVLEEGARVPADARLVAAWGLAVDESLLTGESVPVDKAAGVVPPAAPLAERASMLHAGTGVTRGRARALVTATGAETEIGRIAGLTSGAKPPPSPLQLRVRGLTHLMVGFGIAVTLGLGGASLAQGESLQQAFLVGVSVAVAAVPEG
ncbi:MAG TPA: cation-transporting P-type ATPase, partial [Gaiellaceae bacterium]|nr:cation-transporting P-type ATPase [Gaiellaceae bacterium]